MHADKDVAMIALSQDGRALEIAARPLQTDRDVVLAGVRQRPYLFRYVHENLQCNVSFARTLMDVLPKEAMVIPSRCQPRVAA